MEPTTLVPEKFLQLVARGGLARIGVFACRKLAPRKIKVLAKIPDMLFLDRIGPAIAALVRHARVIAGAI